MSLNLPSHTLTIIQRIAVTSSTVIQSARLATIDHGGDRW